MSKASETKRETEYTRQVEEEWRAMSSSEKERAWGQYEGQIAMFYGNPDRNLSFKDFVLIWKTNRMNELRSGL